MADPIRRVSPQRRGLLGREAASAAYPADLLLIADDPRYPAAGLNASPDQREESGAAGTVEPLDMESVVRRLIALLREEQP